MTVFIKKYPSKGELPTIRGKEYLTNRGKMYDYVIHPNWGSIEYWLEEIELPSDDEITIEADKIDNWKESYEFEKGANFILNKLKGK